MNDYQKMVKQEAQSFYDEAMPQFQEDAGEHGGRSDKPNLTLWLDRTRRLFERLDGIAKGWGRAESAMVNQSSRNSVSFGDPKESAYFAFYKDVLAELKKLRKGVGG
ncbi:MAG: hypothetical protein AB7O52_16360 [Planctomycetota bacterium]